MSHIDFQEVARQLRQPEGGMGREVGQKMNRSNAFMYELTMRHLDLQRGERLLEIGMGNGHFTPDLLAGQPTATCDGCDFSETMVAEATTLNQDLVDAGRARFQQATADKLPFPDHTFDKIITINTIYFWEAPAVELQEIMRVLKPDGLLLLAIRTKSSMQLLPFTQYGFHLYDSADLTDLVAGEGFLIESVIKEEEPAHGIAGETFNMVTILLKARRPTIIGALQ